MSFKSLQDTFIYKHLNSNNGITNTISKVMLEGEIVGRDMMQEAFMIIDKNFKFAMKNRVLKALDDGQLIMIYAPNNVRMPQAIPWFLTRNSKGEIVAVICVDIYGTRAKDSKDIRIDARKLYCLLEAAYIGRLSYFNSRTMSQRSSILTYGSSIYANMFVRVLNKKYALNVNKDKLNKVLFLSSKFFLINLLGMPNNQTTDNYALKSCKNPNNLLIEQMSETFKDSDFADLSSFLLALTTNPNTKDLIPGLTVRSYLEQFIFMYDGSALLALESFPYFIYNILSVTHGAYLNNQYNLENIVGPYGAKIYIDISNI